MRDSRLVGFFKVISDPNRIAILRAVGSGRRSVSQIMDATNLPQPLCSFHLKTLRKSGLLVAEREGPFIFYALADPSLLNLLEACEKYAAIVADPEEERLDFQWPPWAKMCRMMGNRRR